MMGDDLRQRSRRETRPVLRADAAQNATDVVTTSCQSCGAHVTPRFARVFGDNSNTVHGCLRCSTQRERKDGTHRD